MTVVSWNSRPVKSDRTDRSRRPTRAAKSPRGRSRRPSQRKRSSRSHCSVNLRSKRSRDEMRACVDVFDESRFFATSLTPRFTESRPTGDRLMIGAFGTSVRCVRFLILWSIHVRPFVAKTSTRSICKSDRSCRWYSCGRRRWNSAYYILYATVNKRR